MGFLEYSNRTHSNIIPQEEFEELTQQVFGVIATNLSKSLGPLGSSATILDGMMTEATKDGYAILKKYRFHNRYKKMIYNLIMAPCTRVNNTVGDATTTVICLTNALFNRYKSLKNHLDTLYRLPRHFLKAWDEVVDELVKNVKMNAKPIDPEDWDTIYNIAYVVSNGNEEISRNIADTYKEAKTPNIKQKDSPTNKSYIEPISGFDFPAHLITDAYARNEDLSAKEHDIAVMILDHKLEMDFLDSLIIPLNEVFRAQGKKLLILAPYYDKLMIDTKVNSYMLKEVRQTGTFNLILGQFDLGDVNHNHQMEDLAVILRTKVLSATMIKDMSESVTQNGSDWFVDNILEDETDPLYRTVGFAASALLTCTAGCIFNVTDIESDQRYQDTLRRAEVDLELAKHEVPNERQSYAHKIYEANNRIMQLKMKNYTYYVGADSLLQKQIIWDSIDDVIKCVRSAIKFGIVPGCQLTLIRACEYLVSSIVEWPITDPDVLDNMDMHTRLKVEITSIIHAALQDVYSLVLHGANGLGMVKLQPGWDHVQENAFKDLTPEDVEKLSEESKTNLINKASEKIRNDARRHAQKVIRESMDTMTVFDVETLDFSDKIITSAETDMMVMTAASELVKILISGNQCIFLDADVNESHQEEVEMYV